MYTRQSHTYHFALSITSPLTSKHTYTLIHICTLFQASTHTH
jgi:hypothetical protein